MKKLLCITEPPLTTTVVASHEHDRWVSACDRKPTLEELEEGRKKVRFLECLKRAKLKGEVDGECMFQVLRKNLPNQTQEVDERSKEHWLAPDKAAFIGYIADVPIQRGESKVHPSQALSTT